jgi:hypothetical protein
MKKLRRKTEGWRLENPPRTEEERWAAEGAGFVQLPSGQWLLPDYDFRPSLAVMQKKRYGHRCKACRSPFRSNRARDPYCPSCRNIMDETRKRLDAVLRAALDAPEEKREKARCKVEDELQCPVCDWAQNEGRIVPEDLGLILEYLPGWVERAHRHFFRHALWNRFPDSRRFAPEITPEERQFIYGPNSLSELGEEISVEIVPLASAEVQPLTRIDIPLIPPAKGSKPSSGKSGTG